MFWKVLAAILVLGLGGMVYSFLDFRSQIHGVYDVPDSVAISDSGADITVVEFLDYTCAASQGLHPVLMEAIKKDGKIRYVPRPMAPDNAQEARQVLHFLYAAGMQGGFIKIHEELVKVGASQNLENLLEYAKSIGLDRDQIEADMKDPEVEMAVKQNEDYFKEWGLRVTPTVLVATEVLGTKAMYTPSEKDTSVEEILKIFQQSRKLF